MKTKARPLGDRYFVINRYPGKTGIRAAAFEYPTHEEATHVACYSYTTAIGLSGSTDETWEVFVGSKTALRRRLAA